MILAIETTEKFGSIALLGGRRVLAEMDLPKDRRSSQSLNPCLEILFDQTGVKPADIQNIAVVIGPGSFTGLRVGVTAAKLFAYSVGAKIVAVNTFQAVPRNTDSIYSIGIDAQRGEVIVSRDGEHPQLIQVTDWWKQADRDERLVFTGPALERYASKVPPNVHLAEPEHWFPKASLAGLAALERIERNDFDDVFSLVPIYSRLSAAEEKRNAAKETSQEKNTKPRTVNNEHRAINNV